MAMETELQKIADGCRDLYNKCEITFTQVKQEKDFGNGGFHQGDEKVRLDKRRNYLPEKNLVPQILKDDVSKWRMWEMSP